MRKALVSSMQKHQETVNQCDIDWCSSMTFSEKNTQLFFSVFSEYPSYIEFMESLESAVKFLNLFHGQYTHNYDILASRILLLHMQDI